MKSNIVETVALRYLPLAIFYAKEMKPMCSILLIALAAKGEAVTITPGSCSCHGANAGFGLESLNGDHFRAEINVICGFCPLKTRVGSKDVP